MDIRDVLKEMREKADARAEWGIPWEASELRSWADAIEQAMREQRFGPLVPPTAGAISVFETVVMNSPTADMRAIPNQWLLNERALTSKVAEELEAEIEKLRNELADALDMRRGEGPTALSWLAAEINGLREALWLSGTRCADVHHPLEMRHAADEPCPVEALIHAALNPETKG